MSTRLENEHTNDQTAIEKVTRFKYLGCWINTDLNPGEEIKIRIEVTRNASLKYKYMPCNNHLQLCLNIKFVK